ncbi:MAG TPA: CmcJ/NvfI family oxidoreductase, partial [Sphingomicrobium sp.]
MVEAELTGLLPADFAGERAPTIVYGGPPVPECSQRHRVEIHDARALQDGTASEAKFFADHGFVLLPHETAVKDWDRDVPSIYFGEIKSIIRERLLPGKRLDVKQWPSVIKRGSGRRFYAQFIHTDGPLSPELFAKNLAAFGTPQIERGWLDAYAHPAVAGLISIGFWRTIHMRQPLRHMPLALCDPSSIERSDIFPADMVGVAPERKTTHHAALRFNPGQKWYYYPQIT